MRQTHTDGVPLLQDADAAVWYNKAAAPENVSPQSPFKETEVSSNEFSSQHPESGFQNYNFLTFSLIRKQQHTNSQPQLSRTNLPHSPVRRVLQSNGPASMKSRRKLVVEGQKYYRYLSHRSLGGKLTFCTPMKCKHSSHSWRNGRTPKVVVKKLGRRRNHSAGLASKCVGSSLVA